MSISRTLIDAGNITRRNLIRYRRIPTLLIFSTIQPVMFLVLFSQVFGGAIKTALPPGLSYINYLMPGILAQSVIFGAMGTGIALAEDLQKGMIARLRSLPIARSAVLAGRTIADTSRNFFVVVLMLCVGWLIGFRFDHGVNNLLLALGLVLLFGFAFSWISATIGLAVGDVETAQSAGFIWVFPLVFASSAFTPVSTMPSWLRGFTQWNPVSLLVDALRDLIVSGQVNSAFWKSVLWGLAILMVFMPLAARRYQRTA